MLFILLLLLLFKSENPWTFLINSAFLLRTHFLWFNLIELQFIIFINFTRIILLNVIVLVLDLVLDNNIYVHFVVLACYWLSAVGKHLNK
jgi:hypothetical protein